MKVNCFCISLGLFFFTQSIDAFCGKTFMTYRPQGLNLARFDKDWHKKCIYDFASLAVEYTDSFDSNAISQYFFGCNNLKFSGSRVSNRNNNDVMADYFGLPTDFESSIHFSPNVQNVITDFHFYWNIPCGCEQFNVLLNIPIVYSKWALNPCETVTNPGTLAYPAGYMSNALIERNDLLSGALDVLSCNQRFGDVIFPLQSGRIARGALRDTKIADILIGLGYTFLCDDYNALEAYFHVVIPTGTRSNSCYIFEPQIGNGHHWAFGLSLSGRYDLLSDEAGCWGLAACFDSYIHHLFATREMRSYDITNNGPGSRYILLEDMVRQIALTQGFSPIIGVNPLITQYISRLKYAIDVTTLPSQIKINAQGEFLVQLKAYYHNWNFNIGYNLWGRTKETLVCRETLQHQFYGIKGDAQIYGFIDIGLDVPLPLNATQSQATIHSGQGNGNTTNNFINSNADNADLMFNAGTPLTQTTSDSVGSNTGVTSLAQVNGSHSAISLTDADINNCSGLAPRALTNTIFGTIGYTWDYCNDTKPYLLLGFSGEFASRVHGVKTAISQWGMWIKGGINY